MIQYYCVECDRVLIGRDLFSLVVCPICCNDSRWDHDKDFMIEACSDVGLDEGVLMILESSEVEI